MTKFGSFSSVMYYTGGVSTTRITRAGMDGANPTTIVDTGLSRAWGITIDFQTSKLFWADCWSNRIESSNLQGGNLRTVVSRSIDCTTGISIAKGRIFWSEGNSGNLKSSTITGDNVFTIFNETKGVHALSLVPDPNRPQSRANHCASHNCAKVCVLTSNSYRCLS